MKRIDVPTTLGALFLAASIAATFWSYQAAYAFALLAYCTALWRLL